MIPGKLYTPEVVLEAVWRRKASIVLPFLLATAGIIAYSESLPNLYRSETLVLVVPQRIPESYVRSPVTSRIEDRLRSIKEQILSRTRLEKVIIEFSLYPEARAKGRPIEEVVEMMTNEIQIETVRGDSFRVAFVASDPATPALVANRLAGMVIEEDQHDRRVLATDTNEFLESQLEDARNRLVTHERKLQEFRVQHAGELPSQFQSNLQVIQSTQNQIQALAESINRDRDRRLLLEKSLTDAETSSPSAPIISVAGESVQPGATVAERLEAARAELRTLETRYKPGHPDLIAKARTIRELESQLASFSSSSTAGARSTGEPVSASEAIRQGRMRQIQGEIDKVDQQIARKEEETQRLQQVVADYQRRVEAVPLRETDLTELMRDYETLQRVYTGLLAKKEESKIAANLERQQVGEQFRILDPARPAEVPFSPNRMRMNLMGSFAGLVLGLALAALLEYRDTSLRSEDDVVRVLALPVIAVIPSMQSPIERRQRRLLYTVAATACLVGAVVMGLVWTNGSVPGIDSLTGIW